MNELYMIEIRPDMLALLRYLHGKGLGAKDTDEDLGYGVHIWLSEAFTGMAPKIWRLFQDRRRPPKILAYSHYDGESLRQRMREFADPGAFSVCSEPGTAISSRMMPAWHSGRRLGFELQCCPVGRKARHGTEKDLFLIQADAAGHEAVQRETVYCNWARERIQRDKAATVTSIRMEGFRLVNLLRQTQGAVGQRRSKRLVRPQVLLKGEMTVIEPDAFRALLANGVGRHRPFGYGMLLLRPPT